MEAIQSIDERRARIASATPAKRKSELGQFMTASVIAKFMAGMFDKLPKKIRLLDAGAGIGSLTAAFAERAKTDGVSALFFEAWELDPHLVEPLNGTLEACAELMKGVGADAGFIVEKGDFLLDYSEALRFGKKTGITHAILNPPYKKISTDSDQRRALRKAGIEVQNLYSGFVALAILALENGGELVAITPRSFCNGPYFRPFRKLMLEQCALLKIHLFESRLDAFKGDEVLQENVIFHLKKGAKQGRISLTSSRDSSFEEITRRDAEFSEICSPEDPDLVFHLVVKEDHPDTIRGMEKYSHTLAEIGLGVSTGPVVDFRMRDHLREEAGAEIAPLIYAHHFEKGFVSHPKADAKKPNFIEKNAETIKWMMPTGHYVLVRRLSSKEEKRRIVPGVFNPANVPGALIGFDNHLNFFHVGKRGLPPDVAKGLAVYLGSTLADNWLRRFSGHTQVNAGDLKTLRYPDLATLAKWGAEVGSELPSQEIIDSIVERTDA